MAKVCRVLVARLIRVIALVVGCGEVKLPKWATIRYWLSGESEMAPGCAATFIELRIVPSLVDITSIRFAVKLAI